MAEKKEFPVSNYFSDEFSKKLYNLIKNNNIYVQALKLIDEEIEEWIEEYCDGCDRIDRDNYEPRFNEGYL